MKSVRTKLSKNNPYYISDYRRKELKYFCLQYYEWKEYLRDINGVGGQTEWDDPTAEEAVKRIIFEENIRMVEETARLTGSDIYEYLFMFITKDIPYAKMVTVYRLPCGRKQFYKKVHMFYYLLSQKVHTFL